MKPNQDQPNADDSAFTAAPCSTRERWHGKTRGGKWSVLGNRLTHKEAQGMMDERNLTEISTDQGLCILT